MITLIKFSAVYCAPCKQLSKNIEKIAAENPDIQIENIDVDDHPEMAKKYQIRSVPTLIFCVNDKEINRTIGAVKIDALRNLVQGLRKVPKKISNVSTSTAYEQYSINNVSIV